MEKKFEGDPLQVFGGGGGGGGQHSGYRGPPPPNETLVMCIVCVPIHAQLPSLPLPVLFSFKMDVF